MKRYLNKTGKSRGLFVFAAALWGFIFLSCNQAPIFYNLSLEPVPKDPLIDGSPTNMVVVGNNLYAASRLSSKIFYFTKNVWYSIPSPGGAVGELASDGSNLYALVFPGGDPLESSAIYKLDTNGWTLITNSSAVGYSIQTLYGTNGRIFAGGQILHSNYAVYALFYIEPQIDALPIVKELVNNTSLLKGAAEDALGDIYLGTMGHGMYFFDGSSDAAIPIPSTAGVNITGVIAAGGRVLAVSSDGVNEGRIFIQNEGLTTFASSQMSLNFTGGMGIWKKYVPPIDETDTGTWEPALILLGIRAYGYSINHGYREMYISGGLPTFSAKHPGESYDTLTSAKNTSKYRASIGKHPVHSIIQVPDGVIDYPVDMIANAGWEPPIFAATSKNGVWSYRSGQWNAED